jgi:diguanylate cyclase (GGDEF)-like protein
MGDKVLAKFGRQLKSQLRPYDLLFRYGGEEFLICLPQADIHTGSAAIERLRRTLAGMHFKSSGNSSFQVTVSAGLALLDADAPLEASIERADKALYAAKAAGRNCMQVWNASIDL